MAYDKVIDSAVLDADLLSVANAIRSKGGTSGNLSFPSGFVNAIAAIETGGSIPEGMNARIFTSTLASNVTSGNATIAPANTFLASIREDPNAFLLVRHSNPPKSTAMLILWFNANFNLAYAGTSARNTLLLRGTTSNINVTANTNGVKGANYSSHVSIEANGSVLCRGLTSTYPLIAGTYQIIGGTMEML